MLRNGATATGGQCRSAKSFNRYRITLYDGVNPPMRDTAKMATDTTDNTMETAVVASAPPKKFKAPTSAKHVEMTHWRVTLGGRLVVAEDDHPVWRIGARIQ